MWFEIFFDGHGEKLILWSIISWIMLCAMPLLVKSIPQWPKIPDKLLEIYLFRMYSRNFLFVFFFLCIFCCFKISIFALCRSFSLGPSYINLIIDIIIRWLSQFIAFPAQYTIHTDWAFYLHNPYSSMAHSVQTADMRASIWLILI